MDDFARALLAWFDQHGRKDLPWQQARTPYRVWLSEIMLQQTQVRTVIPYFERFVQALPTLADLAAAPLDRVLALWSGLGYYSRARNLHRAAQICMREHGGELPIEFAALCALPGIGRSTAAAILAQAHGQSHAILDGNVRRVLSRVHAVRGHYTEAAVLDELWHLAETHTPRTRCADYTQAIMDLGATLCTRSKPRCDACPLARQCSALAQGLTTNLPQSKPRPGKPQRQTTMLVARDRQGRILLERRPPTGIWARLWSLPEVKGLDHACTSLGIKPPADDASTRALPAFVHTFTHFQLHITPLLVEVDGIADAVREDADHAWLDAHEFEQLGLPAPVRRLLNDLPRVQPAATSPATRSACSKSATSRTPA